MSRARVDPIGLDIGTARVNAVQLGRTRRGRSIIAWASFPRMTPGEPLAPLEGKRIARVLWRHGFRGHEVVLGVGAPTLVLSTLELPPRTSNAPIEQIARIEVARSMRPEDAARGFELATWDLPAPAQASNATHLTAAALPHTAADRTLDALEAGGLSPIAVEPFPCALVRACQDTLAHPGESTPAVDAIVDLGASSASIHLVMSGVPIYSRCMPEFGLHAALSTRATSRKPGAAQAGGGPPHGASRGIMPEAAALAGPDLMNFASGLLRELALSRDYAEHRYPSARRGRVVLVGGGAEIGPLAAMLDAAGEEGAWVARAVVEAAPTGSRPDGAVLRGACAVGALGLALPDDHARSGEVYLELVRGEQCVATMSRGEAA